MRHTMIVCAALAACHGEGSAVVPVCQRGEVSPLVGVTHGTVKIRDASAVPQTQAIALDAARGEIEPFQIVVNGGVAGISDLVVTKAALAGPNGASLSLDRVRLYQEGRYYVRFASSAEGASGYWPDPLIPEVDAYAGEPRNAFVHFDVAANQSRAVWVDLEVPVDQPAGVYTGTFTVAGTGLAPQAISVALHVHTFALPATASLPSAFNLSVDALTRAHFGGQWCSDFPAAQTDGLIMKYARAALDHRISLMTTTCGDPTSNLGAFDQVQGTLLAGTANTAHAGARAQSFRNPAEGDAAALAQHFAANHWTGLFDYSCDEPPQACDEASWPARAQAVHAAGVPNLVTTTYAYLQQKGWTDLVDIVCPVAETMNDQTRASYEPFLALDPAKQLWWYQSCDSHGCGGCDAGMASFDTYRGMPSYVIDSDARQNRSMEWLSFIFAMQGELYYETVQNLAAGLDWDSGYAYCAFGGNGDGALFYPGKPSDPRIGGTTDFPLESIRMKLIREGMEDYEYLALYAQKFGRDAAVAKAKSVFPDVFGSNQHPAELLYQVRRDIADALDGTPTADELAIPYLPAGVDLGGDLHELAAAPPVIVAAGGANATYRMGWDESGLFITAVVLDPDVRATGRGHDGALYNADSIEIMLDALLTRTAAATPDDLQIIASAAGDIYDARGAGATGDASYDTPGLASAAIVRGTLDDGAADQGYQIAVRIPWAALGITAAPGRELGVDLALDDLDTAGLTYADWAGVTPFAQPGRWHTIRLAGSTGCP